MKNKIMFVIPALRDGGAERVITRLASGLTKKGYEIHILEFFKPVSGYVLEDAVHRHSMFAHEEEYRKTTFLQRNKLIRKMIKQIDPDAIVPFLEYVCQKVQLAVFGTKYFRRVTVTIRNSPTVGNWVYKLRRLTSIALSNSCITQSQRQKEFFPRWLRGKIDVVANPVDYIEEAFCENAQKVKFVAAGRLVPQKNYPLLIEAFARVAAQREADLDIFGAGELKESLREMVANKGLCDRIFIRDYSHDLLGEYRKSSIYVLSSDWEGMPNAMMEAMALGMPCIATDCPTGPAELIADGKTGLLVPMNDADALASAMIKLIDEPNLRKQMGLSAREYIIRTYGLESITQQWVEILKSRRVIE